MLLISCKINVIVKFTDIKWKWKTLLNKKHHKFDIIKTFVFQWLVCCKQFHLQWNVEELEITLSMGFLKPYEKKPIMISIKNLRATKMPTYQRKRTRPIAVFQDACNSWEIVVWDAHLIFSMDLPPSQAVPARQSWRDAPSWAEIWWLGSFDRPHYRCPENISEYKWGWHCTSPNIPAQSVTSLCWFGRRQEKPLQVKKSLWSFKQPVVRRTEIINSLNMVRWKVINNYPTNLLPAPCGENHLSKPLICNSRIPSVLLPNPTQKAAKIHLKPV